MAGLPADAWCLLKMLGLCKGGWHLLIWLQITFEVYAQLFKIPPRSGPLFEAGVCLRVILFSFSSADWMYIYLFCFVLFKNMNIRILKNAALEELRKPSKPQVWNSFSLVIKSKLNFALFSLHASTFISDFQSNLSHIASLCFSLLWFFFVNFQGGVLSPSSTLSYSLLPLSCTVVAQDGEGLLGPPLHLLS